MDLPDLQKTTILVTGATGCLGKALCLEAARCGATLILHGRNPDTLTKLDDDIQAVGPTNTILWPLDFLTASDENIAQAIEELSNVVSSIDVIFNCAAKLGQQTPALHEHQKLWQEVIQVNVATPRLLLKHCLPLLQRSPEAKILYFQPKGPENKIYEGAFALSKVMNQHLSEQLNLEFENVNNIRSVILQVAPLFSALRAKTHPGENPKSNASAADEAKRIIATLHQAQRPEGKTSQ